MKRIKIIGLYMLVLMMFVSSFYKVTAITKEEGITKAFKTAQATLKETNVNAYVCMKDRFIKQDEGKQICNTLAKKFKLKKIRVEDGSTEEDTQICLSGRSSKGEEVVIIVQGTDWDEIKESNIVVDIVDDEQGDADQIAQDVKGILETFGKVRLTSCIIGTYEGKLEDNVKEKVINRVMGSLDVKEIEGFREENMRSIVGFSSRMKDYIKYNGKKVNMNIALRYNSYEDKTYVWIGTPLIAVGY